MPCKSCNGVLDRCGLGNRLARSKGERRPYSVAWAPGTRMGSPETFAARPRKGASKMCAAAIPNTDVAPAKKARRVGGSLGRVAIRESFDLFMSEKQCKRNG